MTPRTPAVLRILAATSLRRLWNRFGAVLRRKKKGAARTATGRPSGGAILLLVFVGPLILFQSFFLSYQLLYTLSFFDSLTEARRDVPVRESPSDVRPDAERDGEAIGLRGGPREDPVRRPARLTRLGDRPWVSPERERQFVGAIAVMVLGLVLALFFFSLGTGNRELSQVGWSVEWLFGFPVPTGALLLAKAGEYALTSVLAWVILFPFLTVVFWAAGWGGWCWPAGVAFTFVLASMMGSVRLLAETALRKRLALHGLKNTQAVCTLLGMLLFFGVFLVGQPDVLLSIAGVVGDVLLFAPVASVAGIALHPAHAAPFLLWAAVFAVVPVVLARRLVSDGLVSGGGPYQGTRRAPKPSRPLGGILSKDLRLLARDRNFLVQTILVPTLIIAFQIFANPAFTRGGSPRTVAALAFAVGAYVLLFGGLRILIMEQHSLWLLYSLPHRLDRLLRRKSIVWGCCGCAFSLFMLGYAWRPHAPMAVADWLAPVFAVTGVLLCSFLAGAVGTLGCDPFEQEISKKIRSVWSTTFLLFVGVYGAALAKSDLWGLIGLEVVTACLAVALWQRVRWRVPHLLDPSPVPSRRIDLMDGLLAVFLFGVLQAFVGWIALQAGATEPMAVAVSFGIAGLLAVATSGFLLERGGVRRLRADLGLRAPRAAAVVAGLGFGALLGTLALGYTRLLQDHLVDSRVLERARALDAESRLLIAFAVVVLAPLVEEFLFRGLLFRGFQRVVRLPFAVVASAAIFALLHPALSFPPVFSLGLVTAVLLQRTGTLAAPIAAHAAYNAVVVLGPIA